MLTYVDPHDCINAKNIRSFYIFMTGKVSLGYVTWYHTPNI